MAARILLPGLLLLIFSCESSLKREFNHAMSTNDTRSAKESAERTLRANPNDPEANYLMGKVLAIERNYPEAKDYFGRSMEAAPVYREQIDHILERSYRSEFNAATAARRKQQYETAISFYQTALQIYPDNPDPYPLIGESYKKLGQYEQAQEAFQKCQPVQRFRRLCGTNLAISYFKNQQFEQAKIVSMQHLENYPRDRNLLKVAAYAHLENGDIEIADSIFSRYIDSGFTYDALKQFATELNNAGEIYRAESYYTLCLRFYPSDKEVLSALSSIYLETGNYHLMVQANERLLSLEPENTAHKERLMLAYELVGDIDNLRVMQYELGIME